MAYNTGNPVGSTDPRDLVDNAPILDEWVNDKEKLSVPDRLGVERKTLHGMEVDHEQAQGKRASEFGADQSSRAAEFSSDQSLRASQFSADQTSRAAQFKQFIESSGYEGLGEYAPGITIATHNQYVMHDGQPYLLKPSVPVPYTTAGAWTGTDFKLIGDDALRQDLANPLKGAGSVARGVVAVDSIADLLALPAGQRRADLRYLVKGYHAGSDVGGGEFYWDENRVAENDRGLVIAGFVRDQSRELLLEDFGVQIGDDVTSALTTLLLNRKSFGSIGGRKYNCDAIALDLAVAGRDIPGLDIDFRGTELTKTGAHSLYFIRTRGVERLRAVNVHLDANSLAAIGWQHRSFRQAFTGYVVFRDCEAKNLLQITDGGQAVGFFAEGGMAAAVFKRVKVDNVDALGALSAPITRGLLARSILELQSENGRDFPLIVSVDGCQISRIKDDRDADGVFASVNLNAKDFRFATLEVKNSVFTDCAKRSIKSQYPINKVILNTFAHTANAPTGSGREEVSLQVGGGLVDQNHFKYAGTARTLLYCAGTYNEASATTLSNVTVDAPEGAVSVAVRSGGTLLGSTYNAGVTVKDSDFGNLIFDRFVDNNPSSASSGIVTTGQIKISNVIARVSGVAVSLVRGPASGVGINEFYAKVRYISIESFENLHSAPADLISEQVSGISYEVQALSNCKGFNESPKLGSYIGGRVTNNNGVMTYHFPINVVDQRANTVLNFDVPLGITSLVASAEISAVVSSAGADTRISYWRGFAHRDSAALTAFPASVRDNAATGVFSVSQPSPGVLRVTKGAGSLANFIAGHVVVTVTN